MTKAKAKYEFFFHNSQGAFLASYVATTASAARQQYRKEWSGPAKVSQGRRVA